jgi:anti-anti-sigma regulatory factor
MTTETRQRTKVFISYSREDKKWLERLRTHLIPVEKPMDVWDDGRIEPGDKLAKTPRVFIHVQKEAQRPQAERSVAALTDSGFIVPGVEKTLNGFTQNQVWYYWPDDKAPAVEVARLLSTKMLLEFEPNLSDSSENVQPGQLDVILAPPTPTPAPVPPTPTPTPMPKTEVYTLSPRGQLTGGSKNLLARLAELHRAGHNKILLDLRHVTEIDHASASAITNAAYDLSKQGVKVGYCNLSREIDSKAVQILLYGTALIACNDPSRAAECFK